MWIHKKWTKASNQEEPFIPSSDHWLALSELQQPLLEENWQELLPNQIITKHCAITIYSQDILVYFQPLCLLVLGRIEITTLEKHLWAVCITLI